MAEQDPHQHTAAEHTGKNKAPEATVLLTLGDRKDDQGDGHKTGGDEETPATNNTTAAASEGEHTGGNNAPEATILLTQGDRKDDQVDGPKAGLDEETPGTNNNTAAASEDDEEVPVTPEEEKDVQEDPVSPQAEVTQQISVTEERDRLTSNVENIGPTTEQDTTEPIVQADTPILGGYRTYMMGIGIVVLVLAILVQHLHQPESPPQKNDTRKIDIFLEQMEKVKAQFPNQRAELWNRSKIHLLKHLRAVQPTEPVSLILTAGLRAEKTLHCLAQGLASAFSSALNASVLHIDGASKASQDSDQVKLDIDNNLQGAFEGGKPVAVIHRFEELPPGSTLIFYRYCDHENAAYKKTCLMFTVLLGEEEEIPANSHLSIVEEMVDDHLQKKFLSDGHPVSFDRMDLDKYGGLWSRISHLILPVAAEERIEHEGCSET